MNKQTEEALKMAIAEIEGWIDHAYGHTPKECADNKAIQACKEALEQPAQERELLHHYKHVVEQARDVCKYLYHDMIDEAQASTVYFWDALNELAEYEATYFPDDGEQ